MKEVNGNYTLCERDSNGKIVSFLKIGLFTWLVNIRERARWNEIMVYFVNCPTNGVPRGVPLCPPGGPPEGRRRHNNIQIENCRAVLLCVYIKTVLEYNREMMDTIAAIHIFKENS